MPPVDLYEHLMTAIQQHNATEVEALLEQWPGDINDHLLSCAISNNDPEIVAVLAPRAIGEHMEGLSYAAYLGHLECAKVLTPYCSDDERKNALSNAAANGRSGVVEYLVEQCDVTSSYALFSAVVHEEYEIFEFLFPLSNPWWVLGEMRTHFQNYPPDDHERKYIAWFEQRMAEEQQKTLLNEIPNTTVVRVSKL